MEKENTNANNYENLPDPSGVPQSLSAAIGLNDILLNLGLAAVYGVVALGGTLMLVSSSLTHTRGATRSMHLKWEQRNSEIQAAIQKSEIQNGVQEQKEGIQKSDPSVSQQGKAGEVSHE